MIDKIKKDKYLRIIFGISLIIFLISSGFIFLKFQNKTGPLIIHFDIFKGIDRIGSRAEAFSIVLLELVIIAINLFLADFIYSRERFLSYAFGIANLILTVLVLISALVLSAAN